MGLIKELMKKAAWRLFDIRERRPDPVHAATDGEDGRTCDEETLRKVKGHIDEIEAFSERTHGELLPKGDGTPPDGNGFPDEGEMTDKEAATLLAAVTDAQRDAPTGEDDDIDEAARKARLAEEAIEALPPIWEADDEAYLGGSKE